METVDAAYRIRAEDAQSRYRRALDEADQGVRAQMEQLSAAAESFSGRVGLQSPAWSEPTWRTWTPATVTPTVIRVGELRDVLLGSRLSIPALVPVRSPRPLLLTAGACKEEAVQAVQSLLLRLLASVPAGKLRLTLVDPVGLGQNAAGLMHLADYDEALVTGRAWTESQQIEQRLADLTEHMENVIQKYLRNQFATIEEYNEKAGEVAEPYRVLVVFDFPVNFSESAARRLVSIAQNGPRCGVSTIVVHDPAQPLPHGFNLDDLRRVSTVITWDGDWFEWEDDDFRDCRLELDQPPDAEVANRILQAVGEAAKDASRVEVPFEKMVTLFDQQRRKRPKDYPSVPQAVELQDPSTWWTGDTTFGIFAPLGPAGATSVQCLDIGKGTAHHVLVAGRVGSGKSTLLHTLVADLALIYSPDELELYLVDFKKGVEFKTYATHQLPHARVIAVESEREFGLSVLQSLDAELKLRGDLFRATGVDHIADYRQRSGRPMPRSLLLVDEFQEFFTEDDSIASQAAQILDRLVRQGRAFGIHVLLGSQTLAGTYSLARSTIDQMAVRIALQCSEADSRLILAEDNPAARLLSRPGEAIYNAANGLVEGNNRFQVAWLPDEQRDHYLRRVQALAEERGYRPSRPRIVFEGNAPAEVDKNQALRDLLGAHAWPAPARTVRTWLGEPIAIRESVAASFRRQSGSSLLIVGQNEEAALGMLTMALIGLAAQVRPSGREQSFHVLDFGAADGPNVDFYSGLDRHLPHALTVGRRRQLPEMIATLAAEVQRRIDEDDSSAPPMYVFVHGLQRARDLRQEENFGFSSFSEEPPVASSAQQFTTILREGPDVGVHTLVWCDTVTNLNRVLDRRALREFAMRVVFQMGAEDSANLIDTPAASKLGPYRALFYDEEEGRLEKFRPYGLPDERWLERVGELLRERRSPTG